MERFGSVSGSSLLAMFHFAQGIFCVCGEVARTKYVLMHSELESYRIEEYPCMFSVDKSTVACFFCAPTNIGVVVARSRCAETTKTIDS